MTHFKRTIDLSIAMLLLMIAVVACKSEKDLMPIDPYYLKIQGVRLKVPASYLESSEISHRKYAEEARRLAQTAPGWDVSGLFMLLSLETMSGLTHSDTNKTPKPSYATVWLPGRQTSPDITQPLPASWVRAPIFDIYQLEAYQDTRLKITPGTDINRIDRQYIVSNAPNGITSIKCTGFGLPNPICEVSSMWQGLHLFYWFDHKELERWSTIHSRLIARLDSFLIR